MKSDHLHDVWTAGTHTAGQSEPGRAEPSRAHRPASPPVRLVAALSFAFQDPLQHVLGGVCGAAGQL